MYFYIDKIDWEWKVTFSKNIIRIIGAGYWRKGKKIDEKENKIYKRENR